MPLPSIPSSVIICGGSLAALMHALTLLCLPAPPNRILILERSPTQLLHNQGAGIVASPDVQQYFQEYVKPGREIVVRSKLRHYLDRKGGVVEGSVEEREQRMTSWELVYGLLREKVTQRNEVELKWGCTVVGVEEIEGGGGGVKVKWNEKDGEKSEVADLVIGADGASSTVRRLLLPQVERKYCGYVAWRGTVPETQLSDAAKEAFIEKFTFFHTSGIQTLGYLIPGHEGSVEPGRRLFNWVWYCNYEDGSSELEELMTDIHGRRHKITLPVDTMQAHIWEKQKAYAQKVLPPQFAEAVMKTEHPFIQAVTDVISPKNRFFGDKVILVGDALAGFRPHTAASTGQAAFDALQLGKLFRGELRSGEYHEAVMEFATRVQKSGVVMGERSQFGRHPFAS